jgi:hypothetical protein
MAARVHSCLGLLVSHAGPGRLRLPMFAGRLLLAPAINKKSQQEALTYILLTVKDVSVEDRRRLAQLLQATEPEETVKGNKSKTVVPGLETVVSQESLGRGEEEEEEIQLLTEKKVNSEERGDENTADISKVLAKKNFETMETATVFSFVDPEQSSVADTSSFDLPESYAALDAHSVSPELAADPVAAIHEHGAPSPVQGDAAIDVSVIDDIVEEILMADKDYREEKLSVANRTNDLSDKQEKLPGHQVVHLAEDRKDAVESISPLMIPGKNINNIECNPNLCISYVCLTTCGFSGILH